MRSCASSTAPSSGIWGARGSRPCWTAPVSASASCAHAIARRSATACCIRKCFATWPSGCTSHTRKSRRFARTMPNSLPERLSFSRIKVNLKPDSTALESQLGTLATIKRKLAEGESFASLARQYSEDPGTASEGGNLGCFGTGQLVPPFEEAAFELKPGETSEPVLTRYGYHVIQLHEKREDALCASHILLRSSITDQDRRRATEQLLTLRQRSLGRRGLCPAGARTFRGAADRHARRILGGGTPGSATAVLGPPM